MLRLITASLLATSLACSSTAHAPTATPGSSAVIERTATFHAEDGAAVVMQLEVADTEAERQRGLMGRDSLPDDHGMLFEFGGETQTGFWMKDTKIPLSIAFINAAGNIIGIQDMQPQTTDSHSPGAPYAQAIEANQGWFGRHGVAAGGHVEIATP